MACNIFTQLIVIVALCLCFFLNYKGAVSTKLQENKKDSLEFRDSDRQLDTRKRGKKHKKYKLESDFDEILKEKAQYIRGQPDTLKIKEKSLYIRGLTNHSSFMNPNVIFYPGQLIQPINKIETDRHHRRHLVEPIKYDDEKDLYDHNPIIPLDNKNDKYYHLLQPITLANDKNEADKHKRKGNTRKTYKDYQHEKMNEKNNYLSSQTIVQSINKHVKGKKEGKTKKEPSFSHYSPEQTEAVHSSIKGRYSTLSDSIQPKAKETNRRHQNRSFPSHYTSMDQNLSFRSKNNRTEVRKKGKRFKGAQISRTGEVRTYDRNEYKSTRLTPMYQMQEKDEEDILEEEEEKNNEKEHEKNREKEHEKENKGKEKGHKAEHKKGEKPKSEHDERFILSSYSITAQFEKLLSEFPGIEVNSTILGRTVSYNDLLLLKISKKTKRFRAHAGKYADDDDAEKKCLFIVHALTPMGLGVLYSLTIENYLRKLLSFYFAHLDKFDIFLMPLGNPDGYVATKNIPFWNKNVSPQAECPGVNIDRNFDVAWNTSVARVSSCSHHYPGAAPFSEPESKAVRDVFHKYSHKLVGYFHVHAGSYDKTTFKGDAVLYPRGYSDSTDDDDKYIDLRGEIEEAMKNGNFKTLSVTVDTLHNWYGLVTGASVDYAATVYGIPYAMELVMQPYQDPGEMTSLRLLYGVVNELEIIALNEIWGRVIDVIFTNIHNKLEANENE